MRRRRLAACVFLIALLFTACMNVADYTASEGVESTYDEAQFHFIDVGQGDCILIRSGDTNIMIDAGTTQSGSVICEYLSNLIIVVWFFVVFLFLDAVA